MRLRLEGLPDKTTGNRKLQHHPGQPYFTVGLENRAEWADLKGNNP